MTKMKEIRTAKGITQETLAEKANCCVRSINRYENGERTPPTTTLKNIAKALKVRVRDANTLV